MAQDFFTNDRTTFARQTHISSYRKKRNTGNYVWTIILTLLTAMTAFSWIFCVYVFGHPERAFNYNLLLNLEKLEPLADYSPARAPKGKFFSAKELYALYYNQKPAQLRSLSGVLRRQYILNFDDIDGVNYIKGTFRIYSARQLGPKDVFTSGIALRGEATDYPNVVIEYILPGDNVPPGATDFSTNDILTVATASTCAALIHVSKIDDDRLLFTAVPIVYGEHETPSSLTVSTKPPARLNLNGPLPITSEDAGEGKTAALESGEAAPAGS